MPLASLRHYIALGVLLFPPSALLIWLLIHPFARFWRRIGLFRSYLCFVGLMVLFGWGIWQIKAWLLRVEFGTHPLLTFFSGICLIGAITLTIKRKRQFPFSAVIGLPELATPDKPRVLVTQGIYAWMRNPRYLETALFVLGAALFANYLSVYLAWFASLPIIHIVVLLEERELRQTFGDEYVAYCKRVPRYIPKLFR